MRPNYRVIDAAGHLDEKHINWEKRAPERYRREAPCWRTSPDGRNYYERQELCDGLERNLLNAARLFKL